MLRITTQNGYVEWDKIDIDSIDLPPSEDNYGIPSDDEDLTQKDGANKDGSKDESSMMSTATSPCARARSTEARSLNYTARVVSVMADGAPTLP